MKNIFYCIILVFITAVSCEDPDVDSAYIKMEDLPAANYMKANPDVFSKWVDLLEYTNLFNALNLNGNYTCFVPTNEAISNYLVAKGKASVRDLDLNFAITLVKYHTIVSKTTKYNQSSFSNGTISDTTATGDNLSIEIREGGINSIYVNSVAHINVVDINVTNAVIHTLDKVLEPITESIWDKISVNPRYGIFKDAIVATGCDTLLSNLTYKSTLFVVSDSIFQSKKLTDLNGLILHLGAGNDFTSPYNLLNKFVTYHILPQKLAFNDLSNFPRDLLSKNINTFAKNEIINISDHLGNLYLNMDTSLDQQISLIAVNSLCKNGIIHEVDNIMEVYSPKPATVVWEFTDYPELASLFKSVYRKTSLASSSNNTLNEGSVNCYSWKTVLPENMNSAVKYYVNKTGEERSKALNSDYLRLRLGLYGYIEMKTSSIVKGTYNIKLSHFSPRNSTHKLTFILDGNVLSGITLPSSTSKDAYYIGTTLGTNIVFDTTTEHTIRLLANDGNELELDYIEFQPVN